MENIKVFVRVRPLTDAEQSARVDRIVKLPTKTELLLNKSSEEYASGYTFNEVLDEKSKQSDVFDAMLRPIINNVLQGYNCTLFAYGASGSGKTYTMIGDQHAHTTGMVPRTINEIFNRVNGMNVEYTVRISYLEICNEELIDLFAATENGVSLKIYENSKGQSQINGLTEIVAPTAIEAYEAIHRGRAKMQDASRTLRSHSIITIMVYIKEKPKRRSLDGNVELLKFSKFSLVELAGSESVHKKSLVSFNRVVQALIAKSAHIPYRDSKITRILQESLGGNSKTTFIATIAPGDNAIEETINTLEYVTRVKGICNRPQINERLNKTILLNDIDIEINKLKQNILANRTRTGRFLTDESYNESMAKLNESIDHVQKGRNKLEILTEQYNHIQQLFSDVYSNLQLHNRNIASIHGSVTTLRRQMDALQDKSKPIEEQIGRISRTELELTKQASELQVVVEESNQEIQQLAASVDRRSEYEKQLEKTCERFAANMKNQLNEMVQFVQSNATAIDNMMSLYANKYEKFHQAIAKELSSYLHNTNVFLKTGAHLERSSMLNKSVAMARSVQDTLNAESLAPSLIATDFTEFEQNYKVQVAKFAEAREDLFKMIAVCREATAKFTSSLQSNVLAFRENMRSLIASVKVIDDATASNDQINQKLMKMYEEVYTTVASISPIELPEKLKPIFTSCEERMRQSDEMCAADLANHRLEIETTTDQIKEMKFDIGKTRDIVEKLHTVMQYGQQVEGTFTRNALKTHSAMHSESVKMVAAMANTLKEKQSSLAANGHMEQLEQNFSAKSLAAANQNAEFNDLMNGICSSTEDFKENISEHMRECADDVRKFKEHGFVEYESSGGTPMKRDYKTNVRLVATEPHDLIKEEIRRKIDEGMAFNCSIVDK